MISATRAGGAIAAVCLLTATACGSSGDDTTSQSAPTAAPPTAVEDASDEPTTEPPETTPSTDAPTTEPPATTEPEADEPAVSAAPDDVPLLDFEYQPVPAGQYRVETLGAPFLIDIPEGWSVQPNSFGRFVITDPESSGPGDRDIVMIRPSNLSDPDQPGAPAAEQSGDWPLGDITGWIDALIPGVVEEASSIGGDFFGLVAVQFDVAITDEVECGEDFCVGFATNRGLNGMTFERGTGYRVWWIDGGDEAPIAINIGDGSDPEFTERAQAVLDTVRFESIGPNPIPREGNLWELGFPSEVPAGTLTLPVGPGVTFEVSEPHYVFQDEFLSAVEVDGPGAAVILFPDQAFDGGPLATVDDVVGAFERDPDITATVVGTRGVSGYEATEVDISSSVQPGPDTPPTLQRSALPDSRWGAPPEGTLWIMETPDGLAMITAEWFEPAGMEPTQVLAAEILDSIVIGG